MLLLTAWPLVRPSGRLFVAELDLIAIGCLGMGLSLILATLATDPKTESRR